MQVNLQNVLLSVIIFKQPSLEFARGHVVGPHWQTMSLFAWLKKLRMKLLSDDTLVFYCELIMQAYLKTQEVKIVVRQDCLTLQLQNYMLFVFNISK